MNLSTSRFASRIFFILTLALCVASAASAQTYFSIDFQGPTAGTVGAGDVLLRGTTAPVVKIPGISGLGLVPGAAGQPEVDAMSFGFDRPIRKNNNPPFVFSVDEFATGVPGVAPDVASEGAAGNEEASADVYASNPLPPLPIVPGTTYGNNGYYDGNGMVPFAALGLNLVEANAPTVGVVPDKGDNLDALACTPAGFNNVYYSLDAAWADPLEGTPVHSGTAMANGFSPGDILVNAGGTPMLFASYAALGLRQGDDVDALMLWENGNGVFNPSVAPFDWLGGTKDMLLFSVARWSPLIGTPDAFTGTPIEEGDILTVTNGGTSVPGILVPAEALGLLTLRTHGPIGMFDYGDELNALSMPPC